MAKVLDGPRRGRPKKESTMEALPLRISDELSKQIDEYHQRLQNQLPGTEHLESRRGKAINCRWIGGGKIILVSTIALGLIF